MGAVHILKEIYTTIVTNLPVFAVSAAIAALVSGAIAALISGWVSLRNSARVIHAEYITGERAKWRDKVRCVALNIHEAALAEDSKRLAELLLELTLFLNPKDAMDLEIVNLVRNLQISQTAPRAEFGQRIALLLKHDWDRAKREAQPLFKWFFKGIWEIGREISHLRYQPSWKRTSYEEFVRDERKCAQRRRKTLPPAAP